jgi:hypothetical protein
MKGLWQAVGIFVASATLLVAQESAPAFTWNAPKVEASIFGPALDMLDSERDSYATNLAIYASNRVIAAKASPASLDEARRLLALAIHLSQRNRKAVVASFQLAKGLLPEAVQGDYSPEALSKLLLARAQLLQKQGGEDNSLLARVFIDVAASMDPKNEDAVYASEVERIDHGPLDWSALTDFKAPKPEAPAKK